MNLIGLSDIISAIKFTVCITSSGANTQLPVPDSAIPLHLLAATPTLPRCNFLHLRSVSPCALRRSMLRSFVPRRRCGGAVTSVSAAIARGLLDPGPRTVLLYPSTPLPSQGRGTALLPPHGPQSLVPSRHFLDIYQVINKAAIEKERERLSDELNRGYFADIQEFSKHGGKIAMANKTIIPAMVAMKFPDLEVSLSDGRSLKLPIYSLQDESLTSDMTNSSVSLLCLSFRASSQMMIDSWSEPFMNAFNSSGRVQIYELQKECHLPSHNVWRSILPQHILALDKVRPNQMCLTRMLLQEHSSAFSEYPLARLRFSETVAQSDINESLRLMHMSKFSLYSENRQKSGLDAFSDIHSIF